MFCSSFARTQTFVPPSRSALLHRPWVVRPRAPPMAVAGDEGLDDALGLVVARKTNVQKRTLDQHDEKIICLEEVERLKG